MKKLLFSLFLAALLTFPSFSSAFADFPPSSWTRQTGYFDKISHKLGFGFLNTATGWTALFFEPARPGNKFAGLAKGIGYTVSNTAGGLIHAVTFPVPLDVPLPGGGISREYKS